MYVCIPALTLGVLSCASALRSGGMRERSRGKWKDTFAEVCCVCELTAREWLLRDCARGFVRAAVLLPAKVLYLY